MYSDGPRVYTGATDFRAVADHAKYRIRFTKLRNIEMPETADPNPDLLFGREDFVFTRPSVISHDEDGAGLDDLRARYRVRAGHLYLDFGYNGKGSFKGKIYAVDYATRTLKLILDVTNRRYDHLNIADILPVDYGQAMLAMTAGGGVTADALLPTAAIIRMGLFQIANAGVVAEEDIDAYRAALIGLVAQQDQAAREAEAARESASVAGGASAASTSGRDATFFGINQTALPITVEEVAAKLLGNYFVSVTVPGPEDIADVIRQYLEFSGQSFAEINNEEFVTTVLEAYFPSSRTSMKMILPENDNGASIRAALEIISRAPPVSHTATAGGAGAGSASALVAAAAAPTEPRHEVRYPVHLMALSVPDPYYRSVLVNIFTQPRFAPTVDQLAGLIKALNNPSYSAFVVQKLEVDGKRDKLKGLVACAEGYSVIRPYLGEAEARYLLTILLENYISSLHGRIGAGAGTLVATFATRALEACKVVTGHFTATQKLNAAYALRTWVLAADGFKPVIRAEHRAALRDGELGRIAALAGLTLDPVASSAASDLAAGSR